MDPRLLVIARWFIAPLAVAGLSLALGSSYAATITLYGIVDTGVSVGRVSRAAGVPGGPLAASTLGMNTGVLVGGSRWGITGTESLGLGWSTQFVLEGGVNTDNGERAQFGRAFGRQATLSLRREGWFELDLGLQMNLASRYFLGMDPFHGGTSQLALGTSFGNANVVRYANLLQLQATPSRELKLGVSYSFDASLPAAYGTSGGSVMPVPWAMTGFASSEKLRVVSAGFQYQHRSLTVAAGYDHAFAPVTTPQGLTTSGPTAWLFGAQYDFKMLAVSAIIGQSFNGAFDGQLPGSAWPDSGLASTTPGSAIRFQDGYDSGSLFLGLTVPLATRWTLAGSWQAMQPRGQLAKNSSYGTQQVYSLGLLHRVSPRLTFYLFASDARNYAMIRTARSQVAGAGLAYSF